MNKIRVMLADDNRNILRLLSEYLNRQADVEVVAAVSDGMEIPAAVIKNTPDILVLDIIMPRRDGFMTLEALNDFIMRAIRLGASYYMVKPFDMNLLHARIVEIAGDREAVTAPLPEPGTSESVDEQITNLFLTLGIPAHIKGYQYLREAVRMVLEDHDLINRITKMRATVLVQGKYSSRARKPLPQGVCGTVGCKLSF